MSYTNYSYLVFLPKESDHTLKALKKELEDFYEDIDEVTLKATIEGAEMRIDLEGYSFFLNESREAHVKEESAEIANEFAPDDIKEKVANCTRRWELSGSPDPNMDFFNDHLFLLEAFEKLGACYIFDQNESSFT
jgi:hypothetical protein